MKRMSVTISILLTLMITLFGCYKDIIKPELASGPDDLPPQQISFQNELAPMFSANCALAGCHVSGAHSPSLVSSISYSEIVNGGFLNLADPKKSKLYQLITGEMAQYMPSPVKANQQKIYDWIRNGAPKN